MKNPLTPAGIEPATFRFVAQHLNHCATAVPLRNCTNLKKKIPVTLAAIEPETFRFVAQHLNHCATAVPLRNCTNLKKKNSSDTSWDRTRDLPICSTAP